jgi:hypothetical protein
MNTTNSLNVTLVSDPPKGPNVRIKQEKWDHQMDRRTSVRFFTNEAREAQGLKQSRFLTDPGSRQFFTRDRDLGQTFTTPTGGPFRLKAITLRTGPADDAVGRDAPGKAVSLQIFAVHGTPFINDNGTPDEKGDDFITGETYESLWVVSGGTLPGVLDKNQWLRWEITGDEAIVLQPSTRCAFLVMFDQPFGQQELALANQYPGPTHHFGGHGIRREGQAPNPSSPFGDSSWIESVEKSSLPSDWAKRLAQQPGTWGRPDVDTYRVLTVYIEGD